MYPLRSPLRSLRRVTGDWAKNHSNDLGGAPCQRGTAGAAGGPRGSPSEAAGTGSPRRLPRGGGGGPVGWPTSEGLGTICCVLGMPTVSHTQSSARNVRHFACSSVGGGGARSGGGGAAYLSNPLVLASAAADDTRASGGVRLPNHPEVGHRWLGEGWGSTRPSQPTSSGGGGRVGVGAHCTPSGRGSPAPPRRSAPAARGCCGTPPRWPPPPRTRA